MANTKISQLPSWSGTAADLRWFVMNNSGETETFKFSGWTSQIVPADGSNSVRSIYFTSDKNKSPYGVLIGGLTTNVINSTGNYNAIVGGEGCTITAGEDNGIFVAKNSTTDGSSNYSVIIGGRTHTINNQFGFIGGGAQNTCGYLSATIAGFNLNASNQSHIIGGESNTSSAAYGGIWGGVSNNVNGAGATIISAYGSLINNASYGMIGGGLSNKIYGGNDNGYSIIGGSSNVVAANGAYGLFAYGGSANRIQNFAGAANATRYNYGGILGGYNNYIGSSRASSDGTTAGQNAYPLILGGDVNTIIGSSDPSTTGINWYSAILNSSNSQISGGTTGGTIINSVSSTISGRTRATMIGTSGRTADADNTTFVENAHAFRTYSTSVQAVSSGSTFTCNLNNGGKAQFYLTANTTIDITNVRDGQSFIIKTQTDGNYTITWTATGYTFVFEGGLKDPGNTTIDLFVFEVFGSVIYGNRRHNYS